MDWTFVERPVRDVVDLLDTVPQGEEYAQYVDRHWYELVDRYGPCVMWNDIGYPAAANVNQLFADYYNTIGDGVVNDRFMQVNLSGSVVGKVLRTRAVRSLVARVLRWAFARLDALPVLGHCDFKTPEYAAFGKTTQGKWEATRGIGYSFGYNRTETAEQLISTEELIRSFVDIVSKNGNLLLNVGPMADGTIPVAQRERLLGLGRWLEVNGEAIFGSRPWLRAEGRADEGTPVRFTKKGSSTYAIVLDRPRRSQVAIDLPSDGPYAAVRLLGHDKPLDWRQDGHRVTVTLPEGLPQSPVYVLRIGSDRD
jgi:alpha-L-fucosidase